MTITRQGIVRGSRRAKITESDLLKREFMETHILTSDDGTDDEGHVYAAMAAGGYDIGDDWGGDGGSTNTGVRVVSVTIADNDATKRKWEVEVEYSSELPSGSLPKGGGGTTPPDWSPEIEWDTEFIEDVAIKDRDGRFVLNGAGEPPEFPPVHKMTPIKVLRVSRYVSSFTAALIEQYAAKTNSDNFLGFPPDTGLCFGIRATAHFIYGFQYWQVSFVIKFRTDFDKWRGKSWNIGKTFYDSGGVRKKSDDLTDGSGTSRGLPYVALTSAGFAKLSGEPDPLYFNLYQQAPFAALVQ